MSADADAVTDRAAIAEHVIEVSVAGIDDDGPGRLVPVEADDLLAQPVGQRGILVGGLRRRVDITPRIARVLRISLRLHRRVAERLGLCREGHGQQCCREGNGGGGAQREAATDWREPCHVLPHWMCIR
ncbi:hypothetical protein ACVWXQ_005261 [Bradyrhizobium sp. S3.14.4]